MSIRIAASLPDRFKGLLALKDFEGTLMLVPCCDVHTFGMKRPIDIAFVSEQGMVIEVHRGVGAGRRVRCKQAVAALERYARAEPWVERGDYLEMIPHMAIPECGKR